VLVGGGGLCVGGWGGVGVGVLWVCVWVGGGVGGRVCVSPSVSFTVFEIFKQERPKAP